MQLCELLPRLALLADRFAVVRSMTHGNGGHDGGMHVAMTGHSTPDATRPISVRSLRGYAPRRGICRRMSGCRTWRAMSSRAILGGGFLGPAFSPLRVATDLDNPSAAEFRFTAFDPPAGTTAETLQARRQLLKRLNSPAATRTCRPRSLDFRNRRSSWSPAPRRAQAFDLERESDDVRERYGRHPLGQNLLMARRWSKRVCGSSASRPGAAWRRARNSPTCRLGTCTGPSRPTSAAFLERILRLGVRAAARGPIGFGVA